MSHARVSALGHPLQSNAIGQGEFKRLIAQAGVKPIKFHGLRHTCATLLLQAGVPVHVVQERLGHKRIEVTLDPLGEILEYTYDAEFPFWCPKWGLPLSEPSGSRHDFLLVC